MQYLVLVGVSGAGKTSLRDNLCKRYPEIFYKVNQATTRPMRETETEDDYLFITEEQYDNMKDELIGRTEVNGYRYGSLVQPDIAHGRIGIIVLNELGLEDFKQHSNPNRYISIGLNRRLEDLEVKRDGRDDEYLRKEKEVLELCNYVINLEPGIYADTDMVKNLCLTHFNKHFDRVELVISEYQSLITSYNDGEVLSSNKISNKVIGAEFYDLIDKMIDTEIIEPELAEPISGARFFANKALEEMNKKRIIH